MGNQLRKIISTLLNKAEERRPHTEDGHHLKSLIEERKRLEELVQNGRGNYYTNLQELVAVDEKIMNIFKENGREIDLSLLS
jgi:hypothetical protein